MAHTEAQKQHRSNTLNDLNAKDWLASTVSVWHQRGLGAKHPDTQIERQHPAPFSFTDVAKLIRFFTKSGQTVLDPFVGIGSTLKAACLEGRPGIGIELNPRYAELAEERLDREIHGSLFEMPEQTVIPGDAREILPTLPSESVDFIVTSPPYWNILHKEDHKAQQERIDAGLDTRYSDDRRDLGNISDYDEFLDELALIFGECQRVLRSGQYMSVVVGDFRDKGRYHMFHSDLAQRIEALGCALKGITILYQSQKRVFPYGYPAAYVPNFHHQYILNFRNERAKQPRMLERDSPCLA